MTHFELLKYAATGIASPGMTAYDKMRAVAMAGGKVKTLTGVPPLSFRANGKPLISWSMLGNGQQNGTPAPDAPIMPEFVGERTANLFDYRKLFDPDIIYYNNYFNYYLLSLQPNTTYTAYTNCESNIKPGGVNTTTFIIVPDEMTFSTANGGVYKNTSKTFTTQNSGIVKVGIRVLDDSGNPIPIYQESDFANGEQWLMLNTGSTPLPYEPYGYKIPITCAGQTQTVYLGQVQTKNWLDNQMSAEVTYRGVKYTKNADGSVTMFGTASPMVSYCVLMGDGARDNKLSNYSTLIFKAGDRLIFSTDTSVTLQARYTDGTYYNNIPNNKVITLEKDIGLVYVQVDTGVTINKTLYPMIRREVQTTRKIKKLVLTGEEAWSSFNSFGNRLVAKIVLSDAEKAAKSVGYCSHIAWKSSYTESELNRVVLNTQTELYFSFESSVFSELTIDGFKAYIAQQYSSGTPVTVWYILETPETAIVNEPLCKIGDYADTLDSADAGITIPTVKGDNMLTVDTELQPSEMTITYR